MDSVITKYPVEIVTDEKVEEIDCMLATGEVNSERAEMILKHFETIEWLKEIGVSGHFTITS